MRIKELMESKQNLTEAKIVEGSINLIESVIVMLEAWDEKTETPKSERGKYKGKTQAELKKMLANVKKTGPHKKGSKEYERQNELEFALRAKNNWGKVNEAEGDFEWEPQPEFRGAKGKTRDTGAGIHAHNQARQSQVGEKTQQIWSKMLRQLPKFDPRNQEKMKNELARLAKTAEEKGIKLTPAPEDLDFIQSKRSTQFA